MTIVVARINQDRISIASDTMISEHGNRLPPLDWKLKSICLPRDICVSYSGSPELAANAFAEFAGRYPTGTGYGNVVEYFAKASANYGIDYIIAFATPPKLVTIRNGKPTNGLARTHWIGERGAFERFREYEHSRHTHQQGRAVNAALFVGELEGSPDSSLYTPLKRVIESREFYSVGGFVSVTGNRGPGFRFSVYSDVLFDWPSDLSKDGAFEMNTKRYLSASGENDRYSTSQISTSFANLNGVAFYVLKGRLLYVFRQERDFQTQCYTAQNVDPKSVASVVEQVLGSDCEPLCMVMSAPKELLFSYPAALTEGGVSFSMFCEVNTFQRVTETP